jgi:phosphomannomutase
MQTNPEVFKAYDIRGVYGTDFDEELAYKLGLAFASFRAEELGRREMKLVVASDMRLSSPKLKDQIIRGMVEGGATVIDIGLASTPTFYFAVAHYNYDGGIQVSASHNPKDWNGFKIVRERALPVGGNTGLDWLKYQVLEGQISLSAREGTVVKQDNVVADQVAHDLQFADISKIKPLKVVIDTANGMGAQYLEELFKHLPCELIKMNWELDGTFPAHEADPFKKENVVDLGKKVVEVGADLGITTDGDADRIFFVTETGEPIEAGITRAILSKIFLAEKPGAKIAYDIRPGRITRDIIVANGGVPIVTRVGHSLIKAQAITEHAYFAGESSGHFFLNMDEGCYEVPMIVALKILVELSTTGLKFSEYIKPYEKYFHSGEINVRVTDAEAKIKTIRSTYRDGQENELDGISVEFPDYWFNVRSSNTEPLLRLNLEATTKEIMEAKRDEILAIIKA